MAEENFTMDIDAGHLAGYKANSGVGFSRMPFGHYRFRVSGAEQQVSQPKEGKAGHVMLKLTLTVTAAHDPKNASAVGMSTTQLYAGSKQSPKFMQERLACVIHACKIALQAGQQLSSAMFIGREFDGTVTWEKGKPEFNEETGQMDKVYVNSRVIAERPCGAESPKGLDPARASAEARTYLREKYGSDGVDEEGDAVPATTASAPSAPAAPWTAPQPSSDPEPVASGFKPESEVPNEVHQYRAYIKLSPEQAPAAREQLVGAGFDPDGPIDTSKLPEPIRAQYLTKFPQTNGAGLPPLGGLPPAGGKKGTRSKSA